jgi:hypothetical protein
MWRAVATNEFGNTTKVMMRRTRCPRCGEIPDILQATGDDRALRWLDGTALSLAAHPGEVQICLLCRVPQDRKEVAG